MRLSIIVPAYNEAKTIVDLLQRIVDHPVDGVSFETIVVDDGSKDDTVDLLKRRPDLYTHLVVRDRNGGKGAAVKDGLYKASGDYILFQDADLEYDPAEFDKLLKPAIDQKADVVIGSRVLAPPFVRVHYFWHLIGNRLLTLFFNLLFNLTFTDIYSCYLLYRRELVNPDRLKSLGWEQHAEILCTVARRGNRIYEVPVSYAGRSYAEGKKIRGWDALSVLMMIMRKRLGLS